MKKNIVKALYDAAAFTLVIVFLFIFGKSAILKAYITMAVGGCDKESLFCSAPSTVLLNPGVDPKYTGELLPHAFAGIDISVPRGFAVIKGTVTKFYYKKRKFDSQTPVIYLLYQKPGFFPALFAQLKRMDVTDNYEFLRRTMYSQLNDVHNIPDAFFVIMKSIFIPNLGEGRQLKMIEFSMRDKRGFINYRLSNAGNYFDCNVIDRDDTFFKIYIKDKERSLDLNKVLAIASTLRSSPVPELKEP